MRWLFYWPAYARHNRQTRKFNRLWVQQYYAQRRLEWLLRQKRDE